MAHLISIIFSFGLLVGLGVLLERIVRDNWPAIRNALLGTRPGAAASEGALGRVGACLRASFPSIDEHGLDPALGRLLLQLSDTRPARASRA
jgi:hypothetical protein